MISSSTISFLYYCSSHQNNTNHFLLVVDFMKDFCQFVLAGYPWENTVRVEEKKAIFCTEP
jgi:hypothetical protein